MVASSLSSSSVKSESLLACRYDEHCQLRGCKPNSQVRHILNGVETPATSPASSSSGKPFGNELPPQSSNAGSSPLSSSCCKVSVDLSQNIIGSKGLLPLLSTFSSALRLPTRVCLTELVLSGNFLSNDDIQLLCDGLEDIHRTSAALRNTPPRFHSSLVLLDVSDNPISHPGGKRLHQLVARVPSLVTLPLGNTLINVGLQSRIQRILDVRKHNQQQADSEHQQSPSRTPALSSPSSPASEGGRREGTPIVAPPARLRALHALFTTSLNVSVDPSSATHLTTSVHEPLALLMQASREMSVSERIPQQGSEGETPRVRSSDGGAPFEVRAVFDVETEVPKGTIGYWLLGDSSEVASSVTPIQTRQVKVIKGPGTSSTHLVASPFAQLHILLLLPLGSFGAVELMMQSAVTHNFSRYSDAYSEFPTLATLRSMPDAGLRVHERSGLNLLIAAAFGDLQQGSRSVSPGGDRLLPPHRPSARVSISSGYESENEVPRALALPNIIMCPALADYTGPQMPTSASQSSGQTQLVPGSEPAALSSLISESSMVSTIVEGLSERKSRSLASLVSREEQLQLLSRPTPLGALTDLIALVEEEGSPTAGTAPALSLLRPALALLAGGSPLSIPHL
jgi:hypothetical protein